MGCKHPEQRTRRCRAQGRRVQGVSARMRSATAVECEGTEHEGTESEVCAQGCRLRGREHPTSKGINYKP